MTGAISWIERQDEDALIEEPPNRKYISFDKNEFFWMKSRLETLRGYGDLSKYRESLRRKILESDEFVSIDDAVTVIERFLPPKMAQSFIAQEISNKRLAIAGAPWNWTLSANFDVRTPIGKNVLQEYSVIPEDELVELNMLSDDHIILTDDVSGELWSESTEAYTVVPPDESVNRWSIFFVEKMRNSIDSRVGWEILFQTEYPRVRRSLVEQYVSRDSEPEHLPSSALPLEARGPGRPPGSIYDRSILKVRAKLEATGMEPINQTAFARRVCESLGIDPDENKLRAIRRRMKALGMFSVQ